MRFKLHTGLKKALFQLHHCCKSRNELTNLIKDGKSFLSKLSVPGESRPRIPIHVSRNSDGEVSNHIVITRIKTEEKAVTEKSPKKKSSIIKYPFRFFEKKHNEKSLEGRFQRKRQTAVSGSKHTLSTETGEIIHREFISEPIIFQKERKTERAPKIGGTKLRKTDTA